MTAHQNVSSICRTKLLLTKLLNCRHSSAWANNRNALRATMFVHLLRLSTITRKFTKWTFEWNSPPIRSRFTLKELKSQIIIIFHSFCRMFLLISYYRLFNLLETYICAQRIFFLIYLYICDFFINFFLYKDISNIYQSLK